VTAAGRPDQRFRPFRRRFAVRCIETVADVVGVSVAVAKSQSRRSLVKLRELLGENLFT
jgi:hypothetical protein